MKVYIAILLVGTVLGVALADEENKEKMKAIAMECMKEHKVEMQEAKDLMTGKKDHAEASENAKCSMRCVMEKAGLMDPATSKFQPEAVRALHKDDPNVEGALKKCGSLDNANPCEKAFEITVCMMENFDHKH